MVKRWFKSKTIIGALVAILAGVLEQSGIVIYGETRDALADNVYQLIQIGGAMFAIYGRVKAESKIGKD